MMNNKITRKIRRMQLLEEYVNMLQIEIGNKRKRIESYQNKLKEHIDNDGDEYEFQYLQDYIESETIDIEEAEKLLADFEKIA